MPKPNFLIIGSTKAGTTSLHRYLSMHPEVYLPETKEPHFLCFSNRHPNFVGPGSKSFNEEIITEQDVYFDLFSRSKVGLKKACGEASVMYIYYYKELVENIKKYLGNDIKLVLVLRNPIERAFSSYLHLIRDGLEDSITFRDSLDKEGARKEENWMPLFYYTSLSFYDEAIQYIYDNYTKENLKIYLYEDFAVNPAHVYQDICGFIGVDVGYTPDFSVKYNVSGKPKSDLLHQMYLIFRENKYGTRFVKHMIPDRIKQRLIGVNLSKPKIQSADSDYLIDRFSSSILNLENILDRDLSSWKC